MSLKEHSIVPVTLITTTFAENSTPEYTETIAQFLGPCLELYIFRCCHYCISALLCLLSGKRQRTVFRRKFNCRFWTTSWTLLRNNYSYFVQQSTRLKDFIRISASLSTMASSMNKRGVTRLCPSLILSIMARPPSQYPRDCIFLRRPWRNHSAGCDWA